jgi:hypothetical protein
MSRPERTEAAAYYFTYIDRIQQDDIVGVMERQLGHFRRKIAASVRAGEVEHPADIEPSE